MIVMSGSVDYCIRSVRSMDMLNLFRCFFLHHQYDIRIMDLCASQPIDRIGGFLNNPLAAQPQGGDARSPRSLVAAVHANITLPAAGVCAIPLLCRM